MSSSANPVGMREKYFPIFSHRLDLGIQPLCAWIAWILASWRAISLFRNKTAQKLKHNTALFRCHNSSLPYLCGISFYIPIVTVTLPGQVRSAYHMLSPRLLSLHPNSTSSLLSLQPCCSASQTRVNGYHPWLLMPPYRNFWPINITFCSLATNSHWHTSTHLSPVSLLPPKTNPATVKILITVRYYCGYDPQK